MGPKPRSLPSRQWSCSELGDSNMRMLAVKKEAEKEDELQRQIEETYDLLFVFWIDVSWTKLINMFFVHWLCWYGGPCLGV